MRTTQNKTMAPKLPGRGWCFHRGAKLVDNRAETKPGEPAAWYCPSCQNYAYLVPDE